MSLKGSEVRFRAAKKGKSVARGFRREMFGGEKGQKCAEEFRSGVQGGEKGQQCCRGGIVERRGE